MTKATTKYTVIGVNFSRQNPRFRVVDERGESVGIDFTSLVAATSQMHKLNREAEHG